MTRLTSRTGVLVSVAALALVGTIDLPTVSPKAVSDPQVTIMKIRMDVEGALVTATLDNIPASRDFVALLPLTLTLTDYAATEKISDLPRKLSTAGAHRGSSAKTGDIAYYAPWGNVAVFYRASGYANGLVKLGSLDAPAEVFSRPGPLRVTIERITNK